MRLRVIHVSRLTYSDRVTEQVMECRLGPLSDDDQRWERFELRVKPTSRIASYVDAFGNPGYLVTLAAPHEQLELTTESQVTTLLTDPFALPAVPPRPLAPLERHDYLAPSRLVPAEPRLAELAEPHRPKNSDDAFTAAQALSELIHNEFAYTPDATSTTTTVAEVLDGRAGVCQDFAHVLIGLCRAVGLPARYVSGYVFIANTDTDDPPVSASHAWAEVYSPTHGWRGFDAANNVIASEQHVKMAIGRDYGDVPPTHGTFRGRAETNMEVEVSVRKDT
jgi:transglutaminase-like putative cysteine protease